ncbi:hypothetical protein PI125_g18374 [Phytophthora idaei]|nr:hypothetical protein PI125_g18374 [Phytophthora idaei]
MKGERLRVAFGVDDCQFNTSNAFDWDLVVATNSDRATTGSDVLEPLGFVRHVARTSRVDGPGGVQLNVGLGCKTHWRVDRRSNRDQAYVATALTKHLVTALIVGIVVRFKRTVVALFTATILATVSVLVLVTTATTILVSVVVATSAIVASLLPVLGASVGMVTSRGVLNRKVGRQDRASFHAAIPQVLLQAAALTDVVTWSVAVGAHTTAMRIVAALSRRSGSH